MTNPLDIDTGVRPAVDATDDEALRHRLALEAEFTAHELEAHRLRLLQFPPSDGVATVHVASKNSVQNPDPFKR